MNHLEHKISQKKTRFFLFRQNNSGGRFTFDKHAGLTFDKHAGLTVHVIIEAKNYRDANARAEKIGLYFDGCDKGLDCDCCGDRWYPVNPHDKGDEQPSVYNEKINTIDKTISNKYGAWAKDRLDTVIHYLNGDVIWIKSL